MIYIALIAVPNWIGVRMNDAKEFRSMDLIRRQDALNAIGCEIVGVTAEGCQLLDRCKFAIKQIPSVELKPKWSCNLCASYDNQSDLISRRAAINTFKSLFEDYISQFRIDAILKSLPSAELERTAKVKLQDICWEDIRRYKEGMCASCGRSVYDHAKYCDECGCRLEWDE